MKTILYLGTDPTHFEPEGHLIHYPVIKIIPRSLADPEVAHAYAQLPQYTHLLFTSKNAVRIFFDHLGNQKIEHTVIAIGTVTADHLRKRGVEPSYTAQQESQEGVIALLEMLNLNDAYIFLPRSSLSRPLLTSFLEKQKIKHLACDLYDTRVLKPDSLLDLGQVDEIVFTSPSTVHAFIEIFGSLPRDKKLIPIGPVTEDAIMSLYKNT